MRIAVNTRFLIKNKMEGFGWVTYETMKRITQNHPEHEFIFFFDRTFDDEFIFSKNITPVVVNPQARHPFLYYWWFEIAIPYKLQKYKADLFFSPDGFLSLSTSVPSINIIHDLNFIPNPMDLPFMMRHYYHYYFPLFAKKAKKIITVSNYSKTDIIKYFKIPDEKINVVYNGASELYKPVSEEIKNNVKKIYAKGCNYLIFVGSLHPRKNISRLLLAFEELKKTITSEVKLVIVGSKMFKTRDIEKIYETMQAKNDVLFTGWLAPTELSQLLASALALVFTPVYEGFGIPIAEAMYCDTPVITSNVTSMPEVGGEACLYVNPYSVDSIKNAMLKIISDESLRNSLINRGKIQRQKFNWDNSAKQIWKTIEQCLP